MKKVLFILVAIFSITATSFYPAQGQANEKLNVAILIFDGVQIIDYTGPYEVFGSRGRRNVFTVAEKSDVVTTAMGMKVVPAFTFENHPKADILVIPGGGNSIPGKNARGVGIQMENKKLLNWIQQKSIDAKYVLSVCNGAFLIAKAGLLENLSATTTAGWIPELKNVSPTTKLVYEQRFVDNGKVITTAGLSSGIDGALHVIEKMDGIGWAKMIALSIEYDWQPDSDYSRAMLADMKLPGSIYGAFYSPTNAEPIDLNGGRNSWEEKWLVKTTSSAQEILEKINEKWSTEANWSRVKTDKSKNIWQMKDKNGEVWKGQASVEPMNKEKNKLRIILRIFKEE